jgi:hypothetical protein
MLDAVQFLNVAVKKTIEFYGTDEFNLTVNVRQSGGLYYAESYANKDMKVEE